MKKLLLTLGLLLVVNQSNCGLFDDSMAFLKKTANSLFDKGKKYLSENSDKILGMVKEKGAELLQKGTEMAKEKVASMMSGGGVVDMVEAEKLVLNTATTESDSEAQELATQAKNIVATNPGLTPTEQQAILQESQKLANQNRTALVKQAQESIAKKREALKSSIYEK